MAAIEEINETGGKAKGGGRTLRVLVLVLFLLIAVGASIAAVVVLTGWGLPAGEAATTAEEAVEPEPEPPIYLPVDPPLVVNFERGNRVSYLQVGIDVMSRKQEALDRVQANMPMLRNNLILLFSGQDYESLSTRAGKEALREDVLRVVRDVVAAAGGDAEAVEQVFFTTFVMQ